MAVFEKLRASALKWLMHEQPGRMIYSSYARSLAGTDVTEDKAMQTATVYACVRVLSEDIASLPIHVYKRVGEGKERARDHPLYHLLHDAPNPEMTSVTFREAMMVNLLLTGNAYAFVEYGNSGKVIALWPLLSSDVRPYRASDGQLRYAAGKADLSPDEVLHVPGLSYDGLLGLSPIAYARESIGLIRATEEFGSRFFGNGTHVGGIITVPGEMSDTTFDRTKAQFTQMYSGLQRSHGVPILERGAKFERLGIPPEDAQFLETRKFQRSEIAAIYRVPPHMIGDLEHATFSNIEHQDLAYLQRALVPWLVRWEQAMHARLLTDNERKKYVIEHDTANFLRGDTASRMQAYATAIQNGIMTPNEARARENLNPMPGGDTLLLPLNMRDASANDAESDSGKNGSSAQDDASMRSASHDCTCGHCVPTSNNTTVGAGISGERRADNDTRAEGAGIDSLTQAFSAWLRKQADDILNIARSILAQRASPKHRLIQAIDDYYKDLAPIVPADVAGQVDDIARHAFNVVTANVGDTNALPQGWLDGFMRNYYADMHKRLNRANNAECKAIIDAIDGDTALYDAFTSKLSGWGTDRAATMAAHERIMATNTALVAGYNRAGYEAIWRSSGKSCDACASLNGQVINTLRPPLHVGCGCGVGMGQRIKLQAAAEDDIIPLSDDELWALNSYVSSESYKLNSALRAGTPLTQEQSRTVQSLDSALSKMPRYKGTVYRSVSSYAIDDVEEFVESYIASKYKMFPAYTSAGVSIFDESFPIQYVIESKSGRDIRKFNPAEQEILFPRESVFRVTKVDGHTIYMSEV